jgi:hypothetical protein
MWRRRKFDLLAALLTIGALPGQDGLRDAKPIPRMQAVPQPYDQISFQRDEKEIARYHFSPALNRPFIFPVIGPSGRALTRMGHPVDPCTHSHHNSIWIAFGKVNGVDFWGEHRPDRGRIVHQRVEQLEDGSELASALTVAEWRTSAGKALLRERRQTLVHLLSNEEWMLVIDLNLDPAGEEVTLRYGVYVHAGLPAPDKIDRQWRYFAKLQLPPPLGPPVTAKDCLHGDWHRYNTPRSFQSQRECESYQKR